MANVVVTLKIMPAGAEINLEKIRIDADAIIKKHGGEVGKVEIEPIAFGLKALKLFFVVDEKRGGTDKLEKEISKLPGVESVNVIDVRRAIG